MVGVFLETVHASSQIRNNLSDLKMSSQICLCVPQGLILVCLLLIIYNNDINIAH